MDLQAVKNLSKEQLLHLFHDKDLVDNEAKRNHFNSVFYDFEVWPEYSLRDFWLIRYMNRMRLTNFAYGNGLSKYSLLEMLSFYHVHSNDNIHRWKEISDLMDRLVNETPQEYYYYSIHYGFEVYFNGQKRMNGKPAGYVIDGKQFASTMLDEPRHYLKPKAYELLVRSRVLRNEMHRDLERKKLIARGEFKKKQKQMKGLQFLKLKTIDELFTDGSDSDTEDKNKSNDEFIKHHLELDSMNQLEDLYRSEQEIEENANNENLFQNSVAKSRGLFLNGPETSEKTNKDDIIIKHLELESMNALSSLLDDE